MNVEDGYLNLPGLLRVLVVGFTAILLLVDSSAARPGWEEVAPMNTARFGHAAAAVGGKIYVFGGLTVGERFPNRLAECYDPDEDDWSRIAMLPVPLFMSSAAACGQYIFIFGGDTARGAVSNRVYRYDTTEDEYSLVARMPTPLQGMSAVTLNHTIWIIGGVDDKNNYSRRCYRFNPDSLRWNNRVPQLNGPRTNFGCAQDGRAIWVAGGMFFGPLSQVERYQNRQWEVVTRMPSTLLGSGAVFMDDVLVVAGGISRLMNARSATIGYHPETRQWFDIEDMNHGRVDLTLTKLNGVIYAIGGAPRLGGFPRRVHRSVEVLTEIHSAPGRVEPLLPAGSPSVWPNPANGPVIFRLPPGAVEIVISDLTGRVVSRASLPLDNCTWSWDGASQPAGLYCYSISTLNRSRILSGRIAIGK